MDTIELLVSKMFEMINQINTVAALRYRFFHRQKN